MADGLERELRTLETERPLPKALYGRLEAALLEDAETRAGGSDGGDAGLFDALDAPRPIPPATRVALERALTGGGGRRDRRSVALGVAAAALLVVGSLAALRGGGSQPTRQVAVGPARSVPQAGVPPVLHAPPTTGLPVIVGVKPASPPTTRRSTTTTTWNCGLCAQNGASHASAAAAAISPGTTSQPGTGSGTPAARIADPSPQISGVDPSSGPRRGGTIVTLTGYRFTGANGVRFGSVPAVNFTVVSDTEIRVMAPPSPAAQRVTVTVTYPDGTATPTSDSGPFFTYT